MSEYTIGWLIATVLFCGVEIATLALCSAWFAAGAVVAAIAAALGADIGIQIALFLGVSVALLALLRPFLRRYIRPKIVPTNVDALIGQVGVVLEDIDNLAPTGQVKLGSVQWAARSTDGHIIPATALVKVDQIEGVKVFVSPVAGRKDG